jgi:hypothetical protein
MFLTRWLNMIRSHCQIFIKMNDVDYNCSRSYKKNKNKWNIIIKVRTSYYQLHVVTYSCFAYCTSNQMLLTSWMHMISSQCHFTININAVAYNFLWQACSVLSTTCSHIWLFVISYFQSDAPEIMNEYDF